MVDKWDVALFSNICEESAFGPRFSGELYATDGNVAILRTTDISMDGRIEYSTMPLARLDLSKIKQHILRENDLVITRSGRVGTAAVFEGFRLPVLPGAFLIRFRLRRDVADPYFYRYYFNSIAGQEVLLSVATGSVQQNLNITSLHGLYVPAPSLNEQRAIARILGTLDDKIELNRCMNETLETIARAIFKSWFVDFDPVRAKAEGREPAGMDSETAALFPDSFEETELGMVPKGWNFGTIGQDYNLIMGQSPPSETYNKEKNGVPFFQGRTDFGNRYPSVRIYCINPTRIANSGDTLISVRAPVGDINIASVKCCIGRGLSAIRHKSESCSFTFYMMLSLKKFFAQFEAEGTVFGSMNKKDFQEIACISPPKEIIKKFEKVIFPFDKMIWNNEVESKILASVRDSVIPILVSGTIRFCDNYRCERVLL